jgi:hypothetical protein
MPRESQTSTGFSNSVRNDGSAVVQRTSALLSCLLCPSEADGLAKVLTGKKVTGGFAIIISTLPLCETCYKQLKSKETHDFSDLEVMRV